MTGFIEFIRNNLELIYILILAIFIGVEVIKNIPLSGVVIVGAILVMLNADPENYIALSLGFIAVVLGIINVVGGFAVTNRMLQMFKKKKK